MDPLTRLKKQLTGMLLLFALAFNCLLITLFVVLHEATSFSLMVDVLIVLAAAVGSAWGLSRIAMIYAFAPIQALTQALRHVMQSEVDTPAPDIDGLPIGRELLAKLCMQIYDMASGRDSSAKSEHDLPSGIEILDKLPLPVVALDAHGQVAFANVAAKTYAAIPEDYSGKAVADVLRLGFTDQDTLQSWLLGVTQSKVVDSHSWFHVKLTLPEEKGLHQLDMAAHYEKSNPYGFETTLVLFDQSARYDNEDENFAYVAIAVHELRTPLTMLRGYIEVFDEELGAQLSPELQNFMFKMTAAAQQLTSFVSNILNVARVDQDQLKLHLNQENWNTLLPEICRDLELRAKVRDKQLEYKIDPGLPLVGVDRVSIFEVISNLVDNAIKYSGNNGRIIISAHATADGSVETTVQDFGIGMPQNILKNLFTRFYRNHRSKYQVGGSGLGLFLCKAIVTAHGGTVWVKSTEGRGSTFGFTLLPYSAVAEANKGNSEITRHSHGWIKNHTLYRR